MCVVSQCKSSGGLKCGFPVPNFGQVGPRHQPRHVHAQWPVTARATAFAYMHGAQHWNAKTQCAFINFFFAQ